MRLPYRKPTKFTYIDNDPILTKEKFVELQKKLESLKKIRPQAAAEVSRLAELGDFSENVEYQLAKGRLRGINSSITKLEYQINQAEVIAPSKQNSTVQIGHTVTVENNGKQIIYQILGSSETNPQKGIISHTSPIGSALLGHKIGDVVKIKLANKEVEYKIIKVE